MRPISPAALLLIVLVPCLHLATPARGSALRVAGDVLAVGLPASGFFCQYFNAEGSDNAQAAIARYATSLAAGAAIAAAANAKGPDNNRHSTPSIRALSAFAGAHTLHECGGSNLGVTGYALASAAAYAQVAQLRVWPLSILPTIALNETVFSLFDKLPANPDWAHSSQLSYYSARLPGIALTLELGASTLLPTKWDYDNGISLGGGTNISGQTETIDNQVDFLGGNLAGDITAEYWFNETWGLALQASRIQFTAEPNQLPSDLVSLDFADGLYAISAGPAARFAVTEQTNLELSALGGITIPAGEVVFAGGATANAGSIGSIAELAVGFSYILADGLDLISRYKVAYLWNDFSLSGGGKLNSKGWNAKATLGIRYSFSENPAASVTY